MDILERWLNATPKAAEVAKQGGRALIEYALFETPAPPPPQNAAEFIEQFPERPGISVYACTLRFDDGVETYALGETSAWVWQQVPRRRAKVLAVIYAGDDRNRASHLARLYNGLEAI